MKKRRGTEGREKEKLRRKGKLVNKAFVHKMGKGDRRKGRVSAKEKLRYIM